MTKEVVKSKRCECTVVPSGTWGHMHRHQCLKPAKGKLEDGKYACGVHLRAEQRRRETDLKERKLSRQRANEREAVEEIKEQYRDLDSLRSEGNLRVSLTFNELRNLLDQ